MKERDPFSTTRRRPLTTLQRAKMFAQHKGVCVICNTKIDGVRERWIDEHIVPLSHGGDNDPENRGPAHERCAKLKTKEDAAELSGERNAYAKRVGAKVAKHPMPGSRNHPSKLRKKMSGEVVKWE
jgi:5-methylcytosine-specific restriction endonuclease McrA